MRPRDWLIIAVAVAIIAALTLVAQREHFESKAQMDIALKKFRDKQSEINYLFSGFNTRNPDGVAFRYLAPTMGAGFIGNVKGDDLEVQEEDVDRILEGKLTKDDIATALNKFLSLRGEPPANQPIVDMGWNLYSIFAKGECTAADKVCAQFISDPNNSLYKRWEPREKDTIKKAAGLVYKIIPKASAPATPPAKPANSVAAALATAVPSLSPAAPPVSLSSPAPPASTATAGPTPYDPHPAGPGCRSWGGGQWCST